MIKDHAVTQYINSIDDDHTVSDSLTLIDMMQRISGHEPKIWNVGTIVFDSYHYKYASGRKGDCQIIGFYPRKDKITIYLMDGTSRYSELLGRLGKHSATRACIYIKQLSDVELPTLLQILQQPYEHIKSQDGHMHRA